MYFLRGSDHIKKKNVKEKTGKRVQIKKKDWQEGPDSRAHEGPFPGGERQTSQPMDRREIKLYVKNVAGDFFLFP